MVYLEEPSPVACLEAPFPVAFPEAPFPVAFLEAPFLAAFQGAPYPEACPVAFQVAFQAFPAASSREVRKDSPALVACSPVLNRFRKYRAEASVDSLAASADTHPRRLDSVAADSQADSLVVACMDASCQVDRTSTDRIPASFVEEESSRVDKTSIDRNPASLVDPVSCRVANFVALADSLAFLVVASGSVHLAPHLVAMGLVSG